MFNPQPLLGGWGGLAYNGRVPKSPTMREVKGLRSESTEDHLERIQELVDAGGEARVSDVAAALGLNRSTVSNMVRRLAARGYVNYRKYRGLTLTPEGREVARGIRERHQTLTAFLGLLGLESETIEAEVEDIEHHLKPSTLAALAALVEFWREQPGQLEAFQSYRRSPPKT